MALRNAFDGLSTDSMLRRILSMLDFPRDSSGRQYVNVSASSQVSVNGLLWNGGSYTTYYGSTGSPFSVDPREQLKAQHRANHQQVRATRWTIT